MKRLPKGMLICLCTVLLGSCTLLAWFSTTVYFYSIAGEGEEDSTHQLRARDSGYTVIMSRGMGGQELTKNQAEALVDTTTFTLSLGGTALDPVGEKGVDKLGNTGWHVVQEFETGPLPKGTYELIGTTIGSEITRTNKVTLYVK